MYEGDMYGGYGMRGRDMSEIDGEGYLGDTYERDIIGRV